jgi:hypothetical protein
VVRKGEGELLDALLVRAADFVDERLLNLVWPTVTRRGWNVSRVEWRARDPKLLEA